MSYAFRLRCRIREEGISSTIKYLMLVVTNETYDLLRDTYLDLKYSGRLLYGNQRSPYKHLGANDTYHTDYSVMPVIFENITINPDDVLVDVGCGKGRVINYWLSQLYKNKIIGLELDPEVATLTSEQFSGKSNVTIIPGDAITNLPEDGTIFYFYNPFSEEKVAEFEQRLLEISACHPIKVIYYNPKSIHIFKNGNWRIRYINFENDLGLRRWGRLNKYHDLALITRSLI